MGISENSGGRWLRTDITVGFTVILENKKKCLQYSKKLKKIKKTNNSDKGGNRLGSVKNEHIKENLKLLNYI